MISHQQPIHISITFSGTSHICYHSNLIIPLYDTQSIFNLPLHNSLGKLSRFLASHQCKVGILHNYMVAQMYLELNPLLIYWHLEAPLINYVNIHATPVVVTKEFLPHISNGI